MDLRKYQQEAVASLRESFRAQRAEGKVPRTLLVSPTGSGKSVIAGHLAESAAKQGRHMLSVVHRTELVEQLAQRFKSLGIDVGILAAQLPRGEKRSAPVQIAMTDTLRARQGRYPWLRPAFLLHDEAHHGMAKQTLALVTGYGVPLIGLTATPERADRKPLGDLYHDMVVVAQPPDLIAEGALCPCEIVRPESKQQTGKLAMSAFDAIRTYASGRKTIVFCGSVGQSLVLRSTLLEAGVTSEHIDQSTHPLERRRILRHFREGKVQVLTNCLVLTEGFDDPSVEVCVLARNAASTSLYLQMAGRVMRPSPGKVKALLIDLVGASTKHGSPNHHRDYSLTPEDDRDPVHIRRFPDDEQRTGTGRARSGSYEPPLDVPEVSGDTLALLERVAHEVDQAGEYLDLLITAAQKGYRARWATLTFRERHVDYPASTWKPAFDVWRKRGFATGERPAWWPARLGDEAPPDVPKGPMKGEETRPANSQDEQEAFFDMVDPAGAIGDVSFGEGKEVRVA